MLNLTSKVKNDNPLTGRTFRVTMASFFLANIMTVLGTVIDGFVIGNTMDDNSIAAAGFVSPAIILFAFVGATVGIGFQSGSVSSLCRGDAEAAGRALAETLILGLGISFILMVLTLVSPESFVRFLGVGEGSTLAPYCAEYLRGIAFGIPAMTAMAVLTRGLHVDGNEKVALLSVGVMAASNILGDIVCAGILHTGLFGITVGTSISYYAAVAVLLLYYKRPNALVRPVIKGISLREMLQVNNSGMGGGVLSVVTGLSLFLRAEILNAAISTFDVEEIGFQAYNVQVQVNYVVNAFQASMIAMMFLLGPLCKAEEDRVNFKKVVAQIIRYDLVITVVMSIVVFCFAGGLAWLYLGDTNEAALAVSARALRACAVGFVFQMIVLLFANYIQLFGHYILSALIIITSNVIATLYGAAFGAEAAKMESGNIVVWLFGGISVCHILMVILLPLIIPFVNRRLRGKDWWWMIPKPFGTLPENELREVITGEDEVVPFSKKAWKFCIEKGYTERTAYLTALAIEEMAMHILQNGFKSDDKDHILSIRLVHKDEELILRFRDDCKRSDPRKQYEMLFKDGDEVSMIGLKMIMLQAKEISYTSLLNLNNLIIQVDTSETPVNTSEDGNRGSGGSPSAHDECEDDGKDAEGNKAAESDGIGAGRRIDDAAQIRSDESGEDELGAAESEVR